MFMGRSRARTENGTFMPSLLHQITDWRNLERAYGDLVAQFDRQGKSALYAGMDGVRLTDMETNASMLLAAARVDLLEGVGPDPVRTGFVPKSDGSLRPVYMFSLKHRLKARALFRVIAPLVEPQLSPFLFSYRTGRSHHQAARSVAKRHRSHHPADTVARLDFEQYTDRLDHACLRSILPRYDLDQEVIERLLPFAIAPRIQQNTLTVSASGSMTGISVTALLANMYLNDIDAVAGRQASLYRRVGDDIIICDKDGEKVQRILQYLQGTCADRKLICSEAKTIVTTPGKPFRFLGYEFKDGKVSLDANAVRRIRHRFRRLFANTHHRKNIQALPERWFCGTHSVHAHFVDILKCYPYVEDDLQMKKLSEHFNHALTRHLFGMYSPRGHRHTLSLMRALKLPEFYEYFCELRYGHTRLGSLAASAAWRYQNALTATATAI